MRVMDITVSKPGTDIEAVESLLLEMFHRYEKTEVFVVEKPPHTRVGSSHTACRYRVHYTHSPVRGFGPELVDRLRVRTNSAIHITDEKEVYVFSVDRPGKVD